MEKSYVYIWLNPPSPYIDKHEHFANPPSPLSGYVVCEWPPTAQCNKLIMMIQIVVGLIFQITFLRLHDNIIMYSALKSEKSAILGSRALYPWKAKISVFWKNFWTRRGPKGAPTELSKEKISINVNFNPRAHKFIIVLFSIFRAALCITKANYLINGSVCLFCKCISY